MSRGWVYLATAVWFTLALLHFSLLGAGLNVRLTGQRVCVRFNDSLITGRLEVYHKGVWGTVCDDLWDHVNSNVACKQLGFERALDFYSKVAEKGALGKIWLDNVNCTASQVSLESCSHNEWGSNDCFHSEDVYLECEKEPNDVSVRLVMDTVSNAGRVEVKYYGLWKSIYDTGWDLKDANVICRMLGYSQAALALTGYSGSLGEFWLSEVQCSGSESSIEHCTKLQWRKGMCQHCRSAGVLCASGSPNNAVRLVGGKVPHEGRVEVRYYGMWGTICDDMDLGLRSANVICRMLGYVKAVTRYRHGGGAGPLMLSSLLCNGREDSIRQCNINWGRNTCSHDRDTGIVCQPSDKSTKVKVRLSGGGSTKQGRVEIRNHGVWGTVCSDLWDLADAYVVCRMLNFTKASSASSVVSSFGNIHGPVFLNHLQCNSTEDSLFQCQRLQKGWGSTDCVHKSSAGVVCENLTDKELSVQVRLVGEQRNVGRVEVLYDGIWGAVCDNSWNIVDANVVCRMLGYEAAIAAIKGYAGRQEKQWMKDVVCSGRENTLALCYHQGWGKGRCHHTQYVGVMCQTSEEPQLVNVRLAGGFSINSGRVEVSLGGTWGTICNRIWNIENAHVVCRMLGYARARLVFPASPFLPGSGIIWLSNLRCSGMEDSIAACSHDGWGQHSCTHENDAAVMCEIADAPQFKITGPEAITSSTVILVFNVSAFEDDANRTNAYQVLVEKLDYKDILISMDQTRSLLTLNLGNATTSAEQNSLIYVTAEILYPRTLKNLTVGDGKHYNGYVNAPLIPGCKYRVYVRSVEFGEHRVRYYSYSMSTVFHTKTAVRVGQKRSGVTAWFYDARTLALLGASGVIVLGAIGCLLSIKRRKTAKQQKEENGENLNLFAAGRTDMEMSELDRGIDREGVYDNCEESVKSPRYSEEWPHKYGNCKNKQESDTESLDLPESQLANTEMSEEWLHIYANMSQIPDHGAQNHDVNHEIIYENFP